MFAVFRTLGLALGLLGGGVAAQAPEFAQQYAQRLGGAVDELRREVASLDADARATGNTRDGAVDRMRGNPDELVARRGAAAGATVAPRRGAPPRPPAGRARCRGGRARRPRRVRPERPAGRS
ncbi:hypothetical protein MHIMP23_11645 [Methylobacterium hispanicum]